MGIGSTWSCTDIQRNPFNELFRGIPKEIEEAAYIDGATH